MAHSAPDEARGELGAAMEREAATREILSIVSQSPVDFQKVLDLISEAAARLCEACLLYTSDRCRRLLLGVDLGGRRSV